MTREDLLKKAEKIERCIRSCDTVPQMQGAWNMIENLSIYKKGISTYVLIGEEQKRLHQIMNDIIHERWPTTPENQG